MGVTVDLPDAKVTTKPPHKARTGSDQGNQLNLFLYQTAPNAAWRPRDSIGQLKEGDRNQPPLALNLYYLITAYGRNDDDILSHRLLGQAMSLLHDRGDLSAEEIEASLPGNDLYEQVEVEQVRITPQSLSTEELSRLWSIFQAPYHVSAAYQVSVVLMGR
jgi:hypothetical protein